MNRPKNAEVRTNQQGGAAAFGVDGVGEQPARHLRTVDRRRVAGAARHGEQGPPTTGRLTRKRIPRANGDQRAGQRFRLMPDWERDDPVKNFVMNLTRCDRAVQERMVWHCLLAQDEFGLRVGEGLGIHPRDVAHLQPLQSQTLTDEDRARLANLGSNGPCDVSGLTMTHCVPNERHMVKH